MTSARPIRPPVSRLLGVAVTAPALLAGCGSHPSGVSNDPVNGGMLGAGLGAPAATSPTALGTALVDRYFRLLKARDVKALRQFLLPSFQATRSGSTQDRAAYLAALPDVRSFTISQVTGRAYLGVLVVTYQLRAVERVGRTSHHIGPLKRLTVFAWQHGAWRLAAHAYLGTASRPG